MFVSVVSKLAVIVATLNNYKIQQYEKCNSKLLFVLISFISFVFISWQNIDHAKSHVAKFIYKGNGDTTKAAVGGYIKVKCNNNKCIKDHAVDDVLIKFRGVVTRTDSNGKFVIWFSGKGDLIIEKEGYQSVKILNIYGPSDEFYDTEVILVKGTGMIEFDSDSERKLENNR